MMFDPHTVFLRRIELERSEIIRGIYVAVRDRNWGTVPPRLSSLVCETEPDAFKLGFSVDCCQGDIAFRWQGTITGRPDGTLHFGFEGEALTSFLRNRIGFCVLHPIRECAGARVRFDTTTGDRHESAFPNLIEPQIFGKASFHDLRAMAHELRPGLWAELEFDGDAFETEDQRNWTDASFKTYCTPLALAFPVKIEAGTRVRQSVELRLAGWTPSSEASESARQARLPSSAGPAVSRVTGRVSAIHIPHCPVAALPQLGICARLGDDPLSDTEMARLHHLRLAHMRVDVELGSRDWNRPLRIRAREAWKLGAVLELALHLDGTGSHAGLADEINALPAGIARAFVFQNRQAVSIDSDESRDLISVLRRLRIPVGAGSNAHFCELNRAQALGRMPLIGLDWLAWPVTPQVHAFDDLSLFENLEALEATIATARAFAPGKRLGISPLTLRPRFNAVATEKATEPVDRLPDSVDCRQASLTGAAWTLGALTRLAAAGADSITCFETTGWRGLMELESGSPLPQLFPSAPATPFPLYHVMRAFAGYTHFATSEAATAAAEIAWIVLFAAGRPTRLLVTDLTGEGQKVEIRGETQPLKAVVLSQDSLQSAACDPAFLEKPSGNLAAGWLTLGAYNVALVDFCF